MNDLLDERFSGVQSLQDLTREATLPDKINVSSDILIEIYKLINVVKNAVTSSELESDPENVRNIVLQQLDDMDRIIKKTEPMV